MAITKTTIRIPSESRSFDIAAAFDEAQVRAAYGSQLPQLANMTCETTTTTGPDGETRVLTFSPRTGQKG